MAPKKSTTGFTVSDDGEYIHLTGDAPAGEHVMVEVAAPAGTIVYDQGTLPDGVLDLKFPSPPVGESLLRIVVVPGDPAAEREVLHSGML
jgi:hypothetical protein